MKWRTVLFGLAVGGSLAGCGKSPEKPQAAPAAKPTETVAEPAGPDVNTLAIALKNTRPDRLQAAIDIAMQLDAKGQSPIPTLVEAMKDPASGPLGETSTEKPNSVREAAVLALLKLGPKGRTGLTEGLKHMKDGLKDAKPAVREHTANAFMMAGFDAKPFAEDIAPLAGDKEMAVRAAAYRALEKTKAPASPTVMKLLLSDDPAIATDAAESLSRNKPAGPEAVPLLVAVLKRSAPENFPPNQLLYVKDRSAEALAGLGKTAEPAIPDLIDLVQKVTVEDLERILLAKDPNQRTAPVPGQVLALRRLGMTAAPHVLPLLKSEQPTVRYQAALVFGGIQLNADSKDLLPEVQSALTAERDLPTGQMYVYLELMKAAIRLGADPAAMLKQPLEMLKSDDKDDRLRGVNLLRILGPKAVSAVPTLRELVMDPEPGIQRSVLMVLRNIGPAAKEAAPEVAKLAEAKDPDVSREAVQTLKIIGSANPTALPALVKLLESIDRNVVVEACHALGAMGPAAAGAVGPLVKGLEDPKAHLEERTAILAALGDIGPAAKAAIPVVIKLTADREFPIRLASVVCLGKIAPYDASLGKIFAERLKDTNAMVRIDTLKSLAAYGPAAAASVPDIKAMMDGTKSQDLKVWSAATLVVLGSDADKNAGVIFENLKPKTLTAARLAAMDALVLIGPKAKPGVPDLLEALKDKTPAPKNGGVSIREKAVAVCGQLPLLTRPAISPITDLLKDADKQIRKAAAVALGAYGPEAIVAVPKLREAADSDDDVLREAARKALERIVPDKKAMEEPS